MQSRRTVRRGTDWGYVARIIVVAIVVIVLLLVVVPWLWNEIRGPQIVLTDLDVSGESSLLCLSGSERTISFSLHNTGSSGTATVEFTEDNQVMGTNSYFVSGGQSRSVSETFQREDCENHNYGARIIRITRG
jgi:hypothetical protein